jgi:hypothetical protein
VIDDGASVTGPADSNPLGADPVAELETYIAETEARGESVPPEARVMLERLRELMSALRGLTASFEERAELGERAEPGERTSPPERLDEEGDHD